jgi:alpha-methylacyl-CoA racemase
MERFGLGPDDCMAQNERLVYGRMTGWGQDGPLAGRAGHDPNYIAMAGALHGIGHADRPPPLPLNLIGDFGGGGMLLALGVCAALVERGVSGEGQVVDAAMVDGAATLMGFFRGLEAMGGWREERGTNLLDGAAHFYDTYETSDGKYVALGSIEPQFYAELIEKLGLAGEELPRQNDRSAWPEMKARFEALFKTKTRDEWCAILEESDACFAPVLSMSEAPRHPHNVHRQTFVERNGLVQPAPSPRFSRTVPELGRPPAHAGQHTAEVLESFGFGAEEVARLRDAKAVV